MKNLRYIYIGLSLTITAACSEKAPDESAANGDIQLGAAVGELIVSSRATADPWKTSATNLEASVWFRKGNGVYGHNPDADATRLPVQTTVTFNSQNNWQSSVMYDSQELKYPVDDSKVACIGMYPASGWSTTDDKKSVYHEINGRDDLMFAPEISGSWNSHFPTQRYDHLLAWIKINVCASSHEAINAWGKITQISINSYSKVTVNPVEQSSVSGVAGVKEVINIGEGEQSTQCIYEKAGTDPNWIDTLDGGGFTLESTTFSEVGSVLCFPVEYKSSGIGSTGGDSADDGYWVEVRVESEGRNPQTVKLKLNTITTVTDENGNFIREDVVDVDDAKSLPGKCFVLSLYFTPYQNVIEGECVLNPWVEKNEDITATEESKAFHDLN